LFYVFQLQQLIGERPHPFANKKEASAMLTP
jgi:hypothetical protein